MKRFPPRRLLVAADLSVEALSAVNVAQAFARQWSSALEIVHVAPPPVLTAGPSAFPGRALPEPPEPWRAVEAKLRESAIGFPPERLRLRTVRGWTADILVGLAQPDRADLMLMGTHGYYGIDRLLSGSVSEAVIRRARIPVLAIPARGGALSVSRVLAPWNGSPYATRALRWARELARSLHAALDVLYVEESGRATGAGVEGLEKRLSGILGARRDWMLYVGKGEARARIVAEAGSGRYELVVLSAHRRPRAADLVFGSTIDHLLRRAKIPVLAVPSWLADASAARRLAAYAPAQ